MKAADKIAWGIALLASAGGLVLLSRAKSGIPTLLGRKSYYPEYDMEQNEKLPFGYRNNNPVNIRYNEANGWDGKVLPPATGKYGLYERFNDLVHGYRAALVLLRGNGYIRKGNNTIRRIITKFAPDGDHNYTQKYIADVVRLTGIDPDMVISRNDKDSLTKIVYAMSICENGYKEVSPYNGDLKELYGLPDMEIINQAWEIM